MNREPVGIVIQGSQLVTGPIEVDCEYFGSHHDHFESLLPRRWVLMGPLECEPRQNRTVENRAPVPPGKRKVPATAEERLRSTQYHSLTPKSLEAPLFTVFRVEPPGCGNLNSERGATKHRMVSNSRPWTRTSGPSNVKTRPARCCFSRNRTQIGNVPVPSGLTFPRWRV